MKRLLRTVGAAVAAVGTLFLMAGPAQAASAWAPMYKGCQNYVAFYIDSYDRMAGEAAQLCNGTAVIMRPEITVVYRNRFYNLIGSCTFTTYCQTGRLYVPRESGYWYTATNAGTVGQDFAWPDWAHARVGVSGGVRG
ncbi:hypothetical protein ABT158_49700 [Nonomuraea sp. NPDC001636]|uniref:hypothetical protein n=1 Tax=Nonomuraea sp. NPDC001636 TaxID=3154391 RepID=UPI00332C3F9C